MAIKSQLRPIQKKFQAPKTKSQTHCPPALVPNDKITGQQSFVQQYGENAAFVLVIGY